MKLPYIQKDSRTYLPNKLAAMYRSALGEHLFSLVMNSAGYWEACHSSGIPAFVDKDPHRVVRLALEFVAGAGEAERVITAARVAWRD